MGKAKEKLVEILRSNPKLAPVLEILEPYLPALERLALEQAEYVTSTIAAAIAGEWDRVDEVLVQRMTHEERLALMNKSYQLARAERARQLRNVTDLRLVLAAIIGATLRYAAGLVL